MIFAGKVELPLEVCERTARSWLWHDDGDVANNVQVRKRRGTIIGNER